MGQPQKNTDNLMTQGSLAMVKQLRMPSVGHWLAEKCFYNEAFRANPIDGLGSNPAKLKTVGFPTPLLINWKKTRVFN